MAFLALALRRNDKPFRFRLRVTDLGVAKNLANYVPRMQIRNYPGEPGSPLLGITTTPTAAGSFFDTTLAAYGEWQLVIFPTDRDLLPAAAPISATPLFAHDILVLPPGGDETAWWAGPLTVEQGVTV